MFKILLLPNSVPRTQRKCLGVLGYVLKERKNQFNITFVPSKFIQPISRKTKTNLIKFLIEEGYIQKIKPYEGDKTEWDKIREQTEAYKKEPKFYLLHPKLLNLQYGELIDPSIEKIVINNLHHLHQQHFNHWAHSFRHITLDIPDDAWYDVINSDQLNKQVMKGKSEQSIINELSFIANKFGDSDFKVYTENRVFGYQDPTGRYHNIFTKASPILREYASLNESVSIGIKYSEGVIMADQLLKVFGNNDFSKYFIDDAEAYKEKVAIALEKGSDPPPPRNLTLYEPPEDAFIHFDPSPNPITNYESGRETIYLAMFHYRRNEFFEETFPQTWDLLFKIKANKRGENEHYSKYMFEEFVKDIKPWISLNDKRIQVIKKKDKNNPNETQREILKAGQLYYKVTSLVWVLREVQVMRSIWKELKKAKIPFIPLFDFVMVDGRYEAMVKEITISKWRDHLDPKIKIYPQLFHTNP